MDTKTPTPPPTSRQQQFPCKDCGANLVFAPGTDALTCPYCGAMNKIEIDPSTVIRELDYDAALSNLDAAAPTRDAVVVKCTACGAESDFGADVVSDKCPFCGHAIVATTSTRKQIVPQALLPFTITRQQANDFFRQWVRSLWFAPSALAKTAAASAIDGAYIPAWTYDANTLSDYSGQRGDDYWDTETYTERDSNGNSVTRTRQVRKTNWWPVSGRVADTFDDVLVIASQSLPPKLAQKLEPWDLGNLVPYRDEYLSGFVGESYQVDLPTGFDFSKQIMRPVIENTVRRDIGGDHQRISNLNTQYNNVTFKHILLPIWISAYEFQAKSFRFLVNARTGEIQGQRPYSAVKITLFILGIIAVVLGIILLFNAR